MSKQRGRRLDRHTAEQVLRGVPVDAPDALAGLLAAAAAPPRDGELGGEPAAVTAFLDAAQVPAPRPRSPSMLKTTWAKLLTVKAAAAAAAILAVGGVATAAATGALSSPAEHSTTAPSTPGNSHPSAGSPTGSTAAKGHEGNRPEDQPASSPSPSLEGLCHAYRAGDKTEHGKALESPAFTALIKAAGDQSKVDGYCDVLLKDEAAKPVHPTGAPTDPGRSDSGKDHPAGPRTTHPATRPAEPPTARPTH
ncbi:hypothetical protein [Amycolatopsis jejuensis]|uniref:hypothetical protein n=1 Tax=Amycolatopsis jejuensis TaxID=330084 RepID=UPI00068DE5A5|nr:hypothetical protein [Amycolatopsis jejuensis]